MFYFPSDPVILHAILLQPLFHCMIKNHAVYYTILAHLLPNVAEKRLNLKKNKKPLSNTILTA